VFPEFSVGTAVCGKTRRLLYRLAIICSVIITPVGLYHLFTFQNLDNKDITQIRERLGGYMEIDKIEGTKWYIGGSLSRGPEYKCTYVSLTWVDHGEFLSVDTYGDVQGNMALRLDRNSQWVGPWRMSPLNERNPKNYSTFGDVSYCFSRYWPFSKPGIGARFGILAKSRSMKEYWYSDYRSLFVLISNSDKRVEYMSVQWLYN